MMNESKISEMIKKLNDITSKKAEIKKLTIPIYWAFEIVEKGYMVSCSFKGNFILRRLFLKAIKEELLSSGIGYKDVKYESDK